VAPGLQTGFYVKQNLSYITSQSAVVPENADAHSSQVLAIYLFLQSCAVLGYGYYIFTAVFIYRFHLVCLGLIVENNCTNKYAV
jgi:hypothetical protein